MCIRDSGHHGGISDLARSLDDPDDIVLDATAKFTLVRHFDPPILGHTTTSSRRSAPSCRASWRLLARTRHRLDHRHARMATRPSRVLGLDAIAHTVDRVRPHEIRSVVPQTLRQSSCLLYTSDAADDLTRVDLG